MSIIISFKEFNNNPEIINENNELDEGSFKRVTRIRGGKVQRKVKVAAKKGYTVRDGKVIRMKASEKLARKKGAKIAARKRKAKAAQSLRKRMKSLRLRKRKDL